MCRNIKILFNFDPPATDEEIKDASLQFVRKISGFNAPSGKNEKAFEKAICDVSKATKELLTALDTNSKPKNRDEEARRKKTESLKRFGTI